MHPVERQRSELRIPSTGITLLEGQDTLEKTGDCSLNIGRAFFFRRGMLCIGLMEVIDLIQAILPSMRSLDCPSKTVYVDCTLDEDSPYINCMH